MVSSAPAHTLPLKGSAYRYGPLVVGGTKNLVSNGSTLHSLAPGFAQYGGGSLILGTARDESLFAHYAAMSSFVSDTQAALVAIVNGEVIGELTAGTNYGAYFETFSKAGGSTVDVTNGSISVTGNGTTFTGNSIDAHYTYQPAKRLIQPGDVIGIGAAGSRKWYRIVSVNAAAGAAALTIFPAYQGTTAAAQDYLVIRTGFGSYSRIVWLPDGAGGLYGYYAGNKGNGTHGVIEAFRYGGLGSGTLNAHFTAPQTTDIVGSFVADMAADDIINYKGFLLYGAGSAIGWSTAGFPAVAFPFDFADFPALNITVVDPSDTFISFENLGDQVVAIFANGVWLVQATGIVPEFAFYRLPEAVGAALQFQTNTEVPTIRDYGRPTCSGRAAVFYVGAGGLMELAGGIAQAVSPPIENELNGVGGLLSVTSGCALSWEPSLNEVWWRDLGPTGLVLTYSAKLNEWKRFDVAADGGTFPPVGLTAGVRAVTTGLDFFRAPRFSYLDLVHQAFETNLLTPDVEVSFPPDGNWSWNTPLADLGALVPGYRFGGFFIFARKLASATAPVNLTWTVYAGSTPYTMTNRGTGTFDYSQGFLNQRSPIGPTLDETYVGVVLSGVKWIELSGIFIVATDSKAGR